MLGTVDHPITAIADSGAFHPTHIRPGPRFGYRECIHPLAAHSGHQVPVHLLAFTGHQNILRAPKEMVERHGAAAKLTFHNGELQMIKTRAAHAFRKIASVKPQIDRLPLYVIGDLLRHLAGALNQLLMRVDLVFHKEPHRRGNHLLLVAQPVLHRLLPQRLWPQHARRSIGRHANSGQIPTICDLFVVSGPSGRSAHRDSIQDRPKASGWSGAHSFVRDRTHV